MDFPSTYCAPGPGPGGSRLALGPALLELRVWGENTPTEQSTVSFKLVNRKQTCSGGTKQGQMMAPGVGTGTHSGLGGRCLSEELPLTSGWRACWEHRFTEGAGWGQARSESGTGPPHSGLASFPGALGAACVFLAGLRPFSRSRNRS